MAWGSVTTSAHMNLSGTFQTVQASAVDLKVELNPGERAHVQLAYEPQDSTPTEHAAPPRPCCPRGDRQVFRPIVATTTDR
jgi:hypothetical protein